MYARMLLQFSIQSRFFSKIISLQCLAQTCKVLQFCQRKTIVLARKIKATFENGANYWRNLIDHSPIIAFQLNCEVLKRINYAT